MPFLTWQIIFLLVIYIVSVMYIIQYVLGIIYNYNV